MRKLIVLLCASAMAGPAVASPPGSEDASLARSPTLTSRAQSNLNEGARQGPEIEWMPVSATGPHTISGNEITLSGGGQEVTLEIHLSGWGSATGNPSLGTYQATLDSTGYSSGGGDPLSPKGWPATPAQGCFITTSRTDFVFYGLAPIHATSTATLDYVWGSTQMGGAKVDDGGTYYGGTLIVDVPTGAAGTYTLDFNPSDTKTWMDDQFGAPIPGLTLTAGQITIGQPQDVVWDNGMDYVGLAASQDDSSAENLDPIIADDFMFDVDQQVNDVHWIGGYWNGPPDDGDFDWEIVFYNDDGTGNKPGASIATYYYANAEVNETFIEQIGSSFFYSYSVDLPSSLTFDGGTKYWISIQGIGDFQPQSGWAYHEDPILLHQAVFKSVYFGVPDWTDTYDVFGYAVDMCFQLTSTEEHVWEHKMHFPQLPDEDGWDVNATDMCLADDWECSETGYVTDVHFWGSWEQGYMGVFDGL